MKAGICILAFVWAVALTAQERGKADNNPSKVVQPSTYFVKAERFLQLSETERAIYVEGLMDGFYGSGFLGGDEAVVGRLSACTKDMDLGQITAIITKYVKDHPELWHLALNFQAINALQNACPGGLYPK